MYVALVLKISLDEIRKMSKTSELNHRFNHLISDISSYSLTGTRVKPTVPFFRSSRAFAKSASG